MATHNKVLFHVFGGWVFFFFFPSVIEPEENSVSQKQEFQPAKENRIHPAWSPAGVSQLRRAGLLWYSAEGAKTVEAL